MHWDWPERGATKPTLQIAQADAELALVLGFAVPAAQAVQGARPVADHDPGLQRDAHSDCNLDAGGEDMPPGHSRQSFILDDPDIGLYVPAGHALQAEASWDPTLLLQVPAGQAAHALCPARVEK